MNRRGFWLSLVSVLVLLAMITACGPTPEPQVVERVETQVVKETVIVEGTPQVVEKVVEKVVTKEVEKVVTKEVEVEKVVTPTPVAKDTLIWAMSVQPINLDPSLQSSIADYSTYAQIYDSLLWRDNEEQFQPLLAKSWEQIDDATWEIKLEQGVKFHNGEELTADVVRYTIERILNPDLASQQFIWHSMTDSVEVIDDYTLRLHYKEPFPASLVGQQLWRTFPVPPALLEAEGDEYLISSPVGTGPYKFVEMVKDDYVKLERFDDYWGPAPAYQYITIRTIPDATTRAAALLSGEVDIVHGLSLTEAPLVEKSPNTRVESVPGGRIAMIQFALLEGEPTNVEALRDKRVRQALAHAIDVENEIIPLMEGYGAPVGTMVCPTCFGYDPRFADPIPYDPEKAKELLAEAGYPDGFSLTFGTPSGGRPMDKQVAEVACAAWSRIGIDCQLQPMESTAFTVGWKEHTLGFDALNLNLLSQSWDADGMLYRRFKEGMIMTYYVEPELNELVEQARSVADSDERQALYNRAQEIVRDHVPVIPLFVRSVVFGVSNDVDFTPRPDEWPYLQFTKPAE